MGKEEIDIFFCLIGDILIVFFFCTEKFIFVQKNLLSSPLGFMTFVQIGEFDWLSGRQKGSIFLKF